LDAERGRRSRRDPVGDQLGPNTEADASTDKDETRQGREEDKDEDGRADLEAFLLVRRRAPSPGQRKVLDEVMARHDLTGPKWAADLILRNPTDPIGAVIEADKAWRAERIAEAQAAEKPKPTPRRSHGLPQSARDILEELKKQEAEDAA
jgi:hypothetical protein